MEDAKNQKNKAIGNHSKNKNKNDYPSNYGPPLSMSSNIRIK